MPFLLLLLMISWPVLEVVSIIQVSNWIGPLSTFALLILGFAFGAFLIQSQSRVVGLRVMEAIRSGSPPEKPLLDSGTITFSGILFMIPGFVSDAVALLLLLPEVRNWMWRGVSYGLRRSQPVRPQTRPGPEMQKPQKPKRAEDVIDVEFTEVPPGQGSGGSSAKRADSPWGKPQ